MYIFRTFPEGRADEGSETDSSGQILLFIICVRELEKFGNCAAFLSFKS